jgi:hypothetical protein
MLVFQRVHHCHPDTEISVSLNPLKIGYPIPSTNHHVHPFSHDDDDDGGGDGGLSDMHTTLRCSDAYI